MSKRSLKVLHVTPYYEPAYVYGGPVRSLPLLCQSLVRAGAEITVLTTDADGRGHLDVPLGRSIRREGVQIVYFRRHWPYSFFYSPNLRQACDQLVEQYDIVHISGLWTYPSAVAAKVSRRHHKPYVVSPRGMLMPWAFNYRGWKKVSYFYLSEYKRLKDSTGLHCASYTEKKSLVRFGLESRGFVVPNGIDASEFDCLPERGALRNRLGIQKNAKVILFMGRLHYVKGIELTLTVFRHLCGMYPNLCLVFVGPDEQGYTATIKRWAVSNNLADRVYVVGETKNGQRLAAYVDADIFISLSSSENFGMSVAEAMACGVPVIVSEESGISYWIKRWAAGVVVERNVESVVQKVKPILSYSEKLQEMGKNARRLVLSEFSADVIGCKMLEVYHQLVRQYQTFL